MWNRKEKAVLLLTFILTVHLLLFLPPPRVYASPDSVSLNSPSDGNQTSVDSFPVSVDFKYTPSMDEAIQNATLHIYRDLDDSEIATETNSSAVSDDAENTISHTFTESGKYLWNVEVCDVSTCQYAAANYTLTLGEPEEEFNEEQSVEVDKTQDEQDEYNNETSVAVTKQQNEEDEYDPEQSVEVTVYSGYIQFSDHNYNTTVGGQPCSINVTITCGFNTLNYSILSHNRTGTWANETQVSLSGNRDTPSDVVTLPSTEDGILAYRWYAYTDDGNSSASEVQYVTLSYPPDNIGVTITDMEGCGAWLFAEEKFYSWEAQWYHLWGTDNLDHMQLQFSDGFHNATWGYDKPEDRFYILEGEEYIVLNHETANPRNASTAGYYNVTFKVMLTGEIVDAFNVDIDMWCNGTGGSTNGWETKRTDYFDIYNLGGKTQLETSGAAGRTSGGDIYEVYAWNDSSAEANMTFRNLQHVHMLLHVYAGDYNFWDVDPPYNHSVQLGMKYCPNGEDWYDGWEAHLNVTEGWMGGSPSQMRLHWRIEWYWNNTLQHTDHMNSYPLWNGTVNNRAVTGIWVDFWFNKANGSRFCGGRLNAEYYAMKNSAPEYLQWLGSTDWGPDITNVTESSLFHKVENSTGTIPSSEVKLMCFWYKVDNQPDTAGNLSVEFVDFDTFEFKTSKRKMTGVNTPTIVATKTPSMPQGGIVATLYAAIHSIGKYLTEAFVAAGRIFISGIDGLIYLLTGRSGVFSGMINNVGLWLAEMYAWMKYLTDYFSQMVTFISDFVSLLFEWYSYVFDAVTWLAGETLTLIVFPLTFAYALFTGGTWTLPYTNIEVSFASSTAIGAMMSVFMALLPLFIMMNWLKWLLKDGLFSLPGKILYTFEFGYRMFQALFQMLFWLKDAVTEVYRLILAHIPFIG